MSNFDSLVEVTVEFFVANEMNDLLEDMLNDYILDCDYENENDYIFDSDYENENDYIFDSDYEKEIILDYWAELYQLEEDWFIEEEKLIEPIDKTTKEPWLVKPELPIEEEYQLFLIGELELDDFYVNDSVYVTRRFCRIPQQLKIPTLCW